MIVAVNEYAFNLASEKQIYACPASYSRNRGEYIAFYRTDPYQKITHYAKIENITEKESNTELSAGDKIQMFPDMGMDARVFELGELQEMEQPVERDTYSGVQGAWYRNLEDILDVEKLSKLTSDE